MSRIKSKNTSLEAKAIKIFPKFMYQPKMFGNPDFAKPSSKIVVFVDSCFWHKCPRHFRMPSSNKIYWSKKIGRNVIRDKEVEKTYKIAGWKVIRVWEHKIVEEFLER